MIQQKRRKKWKSESGQKLKNRNGWIDTKIGTTKKERRIKMLGIIIIGATFGILTWFLIGSPIDLKKEIKIKKRG